MPCRRPTTWRELACAQAGMLARRQLLELGYDDQYVATQVAAERWQLVGDLVVCTTTGPLSRDQQMWAGVLHAGPGSAIGGLSALERRGLQGWHRDEIQVLIAKSHNLPPLDGFRFVETRRPVTPYASGNPPTWRTEPAALLFAAYHRSARTAFGLLAAVVQQRTTTAERLLHEVPRMHPLRRSKPIKATLEDIAGGSQSMAELDLIAMCKRAGLPLPDRQTRRLDSRGRPRYTDAEWRLRNGKVVVLEVDGEFHMEVGQWEDDMARGRDLVVSGVIALRCSGRELHVEPARVAASLRAAGVE